MSIRSVVCFCLFLSPFVSMPGQLNAAERLLPNEVMSGFCKNVETDIAKAASFIVDAINFGGTKSKTEIEVQKLKMVSSFEKAEKQYGKILSCSFGHSSSIGTDLKRIVYVLVYSLKPLVLEGHFAKFKNGWGLFTFNYIEEDEKYPYHPD